MGCDEIKSAIIIQKMWRGYWERKKSKNIFKKVKRRIFIANEILETERVYVKALNILSTVCFFVKL
jgi:hypothetical protein